MTKQTIPFAQAREIAAAHDCAVDLPTAVINSLGEAAVRNFIGSYCKGYNATLPWLVDAEDAATDLLIGMSASIEIPGLNSVTGNPVTLALAPQWFDWRI